MPERGGSEVFHINLLKKWHPRETAYAKVIEEDSEIIDYHWEGEDAPLKIGEQLSAM